MADDASKGRSTPVKPTATALGAKERTPTRASATATRDPLIGQMLQDYMLEERIGVGGMGVVYRAVHSLIAKRVAIKVLRADIVKDSRDIDRLLEEAKTVSSINHRGIINIFGAGTLEDGRRYLIMELLEGESLEAKMAREGQVAAAEAVSILEEVLSALAAAHSAGVVHRDLKPANVFLVNEAGKTYVKLLDFGLARRSQADVTRIAGTPDYISPEHARGRPAGPPADLYGFGVLCFTMLTGQLPFTGKTPMEVMEKHVHSPPPVPHEVNRSIPKALSELILKLLSKEPGQRPEAPQVKADLRAATKQLRNASTAMALEAVEQAQTGESEVEAEVGQDAVDRSATTKSKLTRAEALEREAKLADVKRTVKRKWPFIAAGVAAFWILGAAVYVLWPSDIEPSQSPKAIRKLPSSTAPEAKAAVPKAGIEVTSDSPTVVLPKAVEPEPVVGSIDAPPVAKPDEVAVPEAEDLNQALDDFRLGELKRQKHIVEYLADVKEAMRKDEEKRDTFEKRYVKVKSLCDAVKTKREFFNCDDALAKLRIDLYKLDQ